MVEFPSLLCIPSSLRVCKSGTQPERSAYFVSVFGYCVARTTRYIAVNHLCVICLTSFILVFLSIFEHLPEKYLLPTSIKLQ